MGRVSRLMESAKEQVVKEQGGFRSGRGYEYQMFVLKQLVEKYREEGRCMLYSWIWRRRIINYVEKNNGGTA